MTYKAKIKDFFDNLSVEQIDIVEGFYHPEAEFKDPLISVQGVQKIKEYYHHVYQPVTFISFEFTNFIMEGNQVAAYWDMTLAAPKLNGGEPYQVAGTSEIVFDQETGLVSYHQDYYDLSEFIYDRLPIINRLTNFLKQKLHP